MEEIVHFLHSVSLLRAGIIFDEPGADLVFVGIVAVDVLTFCFELEACFGFEFALFEVKELACGGVSC